MIKDRFYNYIKEIEGYFFSGKISQNPVHSSFQELFEFLILNYTSGNNYNLSFEPKLVAIGAPNYILYKSSENKQIQFPVGYIKIFDINLDLEGIADSLLKKKNKTPEKEFNTECFKGIENILLTNLLEFHFITGGKVSKSIKLASTKLNENLLLPIPENFVQFIIFSEEFISYQRKKIKTVPELVNKMIVKIQLIRNCCISKLDFLEKSFPDEEKKEKSIFFEQFQAYQAIRKEKDGDKQFADIYAQTLTFGILTILLQNRPNEYFSLSDIYDFIPSSNPFLHSFFYILANIYPEKEIIWAIGEYFEIFRNSDLYEIFEGIEKKHGCIDPILYFYETFLKEYNPSLQKTDGVWYTPKSVVSFIVRSTDELLKNRLGLKNGLANQDKIFSNGKSIKKLQILDPSTGTGAFLSYIFHFIHSKNKYSEDLCDNNEKNDFIDGLLGFEVSIVPYIICHLNLIFLLQKSNYTQNNHQNIPRFNIYLTNSLEDFHLNEELTITKSPFSKLLFDELSEANRIKKEMPLMVIIGNPPYSGISQNQGDWINQLIETYKFIDGVHFRERKHWLNDDYVKFIRMAQYFIEKNGEGILAFITNHGYIDNPTFRGMRWNLQQTFDEIYILDLHGSYKKNKHSANGSPDKNIFNIQQGVAIIFAVKVKNTISGMLGRVFHNEILGSKKDKLNILSQNTVNTLSYTEIFPKAPHYYFSPKDERFIEEYNTGIAIHELFDCNSTGIITSRDELVIDYSTDELVNKIEYFCDLQKSELEIRDLFYKNKKNSKYAKGDTRGWSLTNTRVLLKTFDHLKKIKKISYRPFDYRNIYYCPEMVDWARENVMKHMVNGKNIGLVACRQVKSGTEFNHVFITNQIIESSFVSNKTGEIGYLFPLYRYEISGESQNPVKVSNLRKKTVEKLASSIGKEELSPDSILDYIYGVLHHRSYRSKFSELLRIDFPKIPLPKNEAIFDQIRKIGHELLIWHLLEHPHRYEINGHNLLERKCFVEKIKYHVEKKEVWINDKQYFENIPEKIWNFHIGGYKPVQKWLKDRKGRFLTVDDQCHYQQILQSIQMTDQLMDELEKIDIT